LSEYLLAMREAFSRFMPGVTDIASLTMTYKRLDEFKAGIVEGDLVVATDGMIQTDQLVPAFKDAPLGALFITGSLLAPKASIIEPDIDWSPLLKVKGDVVARNLCLGGSVSEIDGDVTVAEALTGYYNQGEMRIGGKTRARVIIASDYRFVFEGPVTRKYVVSWGGRLNIPVDYDRDHLDLILAPEVITETNFINDGALLDRIKRGLPILRPEAEIGTPPPRQLSEKGAARLAKLRARKARGETIDIVNFEATELRFAPSELREFVDARELVLSKNEIKTLPPWIGDFSALEALRVEDCGLATIPAEIAALPRLRKLELADNPIVSLPFGPTNFQRLEILTIGQGYVDDATQFVAHLDLALFPMLRIAEQDYSINDIVDIAYSDRDQLWNNPHLEILNISWPAFRNGIPLGLLQAHNLQALAIRLNGAQLASAMARLPQLARFEYLSTGYSDLTSAQVSALYDALPRAFISCDYLDGKSDVEVPKDAALEAIDDDLGRRRFAEAAGALDAAVGSRDLRRPLLPSGAHARLMTLCVQAPRMAAEAEEDRGRRQALADSAALWAGRVLDALPKNAEACWYLEHHRFWLVRLQSLYAKAAGLALGSKPDPAGAKAALDTAQAELDRLLFPVNPGWHGKESATVAALRLRIPG
jgi:hypothetical protein